MSAADRSVLLDRLHACHEQDYFERGIELAIAEHSARFQPLDISDFHAVEVDFETDLQQANATLGWASSARRLAGPGPHPIQR